MQNIISINPFRCRMWELHNRLDDYVDEQTCRAEIDSFSRHGQFVAALGRPLHNDPGFDVELVYGARRLFVARHLNVPLFVELREMTDREALIAMDVENRQRRDVSPYERGLSFARCLSTGHFQSQEDVAEALKISPSQVSRLLKLARLPSVILNAFGSPVDIREAWGLELSEALEDSQKRQATIALARAIARRSPRPNPANVYQELTAASVSTRKKTSKTHDEVITDMAGNPLFRIRHQLQTIALLLPIDKTSAETLNVVCQAVRTVLIGQCTTSSVGQSANGNSGSFFPLARSQEQCGPS